jgi:TolB-like protein/Tfp pilus assembly protein PilF
LGYRLIAAMSEVAITDGDLRDAAVASADTGDRETAPVGKNRPFLGLGTIRSRYAFLAIALVFAAVVAGLWLEWSGGSKPEYGTVAVLLPDDLTPDPDDDYFSEGLAAELISALGYLDSLKVVGQGSGFRFTSGQHDPAEVGRVLNADALVESSVRRSRDRVRVFVEVIDANSGYQIWSHTYEPNLTDVFEVQADIAHKVAESLRGPLHSGDRSRIAPAVANSIEAYDYYLLGQYYRGKRSADNLSRAVELYQQSSEIDPQYAPAYQGMGASYLLLSYYGSLSLSEALDLAKPLIDKAQDLDPGRAETAGTIGLARYIQGEFGLAEHHLDQALKLKPNYAEGWIWRGLAVQKQGRLNDAKADYERAVSLEPLLIPVAVNHALALSRLGEREKAPARLEVLANSDLESPELYRNLAVLALMRGDLETAYHWSSTALELAIDDAASAAMHALTLDLLDQPEQALQWSDRALSGGFPGQLTQELLGFVYMSRGDGGGLERMSEIEISRFADEDTPEIDWRRANAYAGLGALLKGRYADAASALDKALDGSSYAIVSTDFDLFYCTSLVLAFDKIKDSKRSAEWANRCRKSIDDARSQGWNSHWVAYNAARLSVLDGNTETGLAELERLVANGFLGFGLFINDPALEPLKTDPRLSKLVKSLRADATASWARITNQAAEPVESAPAQLRSMSR